jgi:two-component system, response regulator
MDCVQKPMSQHLGTILIVDDDMEAAQATRHVIWGVCPQFNTKMLQSGEELISYLKGEHGFSDRMEFPYPGLVLFDLPMPGMHGFDVLAWLMTHPPHNRIPVVVLTVSGDVQIVQQSYALGARSFLRKPLKSTEFKDTMEAVSKCENWFGQGQPPGGRPPEL